METKHIPLPRQFFFRCPQCGEYRVSEEALRAFLLPDLEERLDRELKLGAAGAVLNFESECMLCTEGEELIFELAVLKKHVH